jgi:erythrin-vacuolar iron transport family protein
MKRFYELSETEVLALAISNEEEDSRIYADFAHSLHSEYPSIATMFADMAAEESEHRRRLIDVFTDRFGEHIPLICRQDVRGNLERKPHWHVRAAGVEAVRRHAAQMERRRTVLPTSRRANVRCACA